MSDRLTLLQVHAHPDDESSKGAMTTARYVDEGVRAVLVCATGGEEGDILNAEMDRPEVKDNLHDVRMGELAEAAKIIGYETVHLLGYRDSGMPDSEANARPDNFWNTPLVESTGKLVAILRAERPDVVVTYGEDQSRYPHPDHLRVHDITVAAVDAAADPAAYPGTGDPFRVPKLYYSHGFSRRRLQTMHDWYVEQGSESPYADWLSKIAEDHDIRVTTRVWAGDHIGVMRDALLAHRTQVAPDSWWFKVPAEVMRERHPWEEYQLARSTVGQGPADDDGFETDLFAGLR